MSENHKDIIIAVIEALEDFLDNRGIIIPNPEKEQAIAEGESPESICNIYGTDYGDLYDSIERIMF